MTDSEIKLLAVNYHAWRGDKDCEQPYEDIPRFRKSATTDEIKTHGYVLTPGRYVGAEELEDDDEPFDEKMQRLEMMLDEQFVESARLEAAIRSNLKGLDYYGE